MKRELFINEDFCAVAEDGRLTEYIPVSGEERSGAIIWGRVDRIMASLQCAFVDIGRKRDGFLPLKENSKTFTGGQLKSGDIIPVQIRKEENGEKGAFLTRDITIPGVNLIFMPMNRHIGVSARIKEPEERENLLALGKALAINKTEAEEPEAKIDNSRPEFGLVLRQGAMEADPDKLKEELEELSRKWESAWNEAKERKGSDERKKPEGEVILSSGSVEEELIRDYSSRGIERIHRGEPLPENYIRQQKEAENRTVRLPHGGNIVIDRCEAMTVIDVNSASDDRGLTRRETILEANREACREIALQTRLRKLSGILILDFIDMDDETDRSLILNELEKAFEEDRVKTVIHGFTKLGLVEMTRKRTQRSER